MKEKNGFGFGLISIINHWFVGLTFLGVLCLGFYLDFAGDGRGVRGPWMGVHQAAGSFVLIWATWRLCWRLTQGFPKDIVHMPLWQELSAKLAHWILLFSTIAMPVSGILLSLYSERSVNFFGLFILPAQPENELVSRFAYIVHGGLAYIVSATILMHVGAVFKHHLLDKDDTLIRMLKTRKRLAVPAAKQ